VCFPPPGFGEFLKEGLLSGPEVLVMHPGLVSIFPLIDLQLDWFPVPAWLSSPVPLVFLSPRQIPFLLRFQDSSLLP
jgi:hypothetical protein